MNIVYSFSQCFIPIAQSSYLIMILSLSVPAVVAGVSVVLIVSGVGLMVLTFGLFYTGFLCKLKSHQPRGLARNGYVCN